MFIRLTVVIILQYIPILNYAVHLKLKLCYMSITPQFKNKQVWGKKIHLLKGKQQYRTLGIVEGRRIQKPQVSVK